MLPVIRKTFFPFSVFDYLIDTSCRWIKKYQAELYTVESSGIIFDVVSNRTSNDVVDKLYVVGTFDTMTSTSQMQFCSVGAWNGNAFEKVIKSEYFDSLCIITLLFNVRLEKVYAPEAIVQ